MPAAAEPFVLCVLGDAAVGDALARGVKDRVLGDRSMTVTMCVRTRPHALPDDSSFLGLAYVNKGDVRAKGLELEAQRLLRGQSRALLS